MHEHPPSVLVFLTDSHYKITYADGKTADRTDKAGSVIFRPAVKHEIENLSGTDFELIQIELKSKSAASAMLASGDSLAALRSSSQ